MATKPPITGERAWFPKARFGMFAHFGLYTLTGGNENAVRKGSRSRYRRLMKKFNPTRFDADEWVRIAKAARCRYIVPTAKHAEGFCLWDTDASEHKVTNTPFGRDIIAELARACRKGKIKLGVYYNCNAWLDDHLTEETYPDYFLAQMRELMTRYGEIGVVWYDGADPMLPPRYVKRAIKMIRALQPSAVVNDRGFNPKARHKGKELHGDYVTPERFVPESFYGDHPFFETCDAMGGKSWGYHTDETFWSAPELCRRLSRAAAKGGNYLLNVEPAPDGRIRPECVERLQAMGRWLKTAGEAIYDIEGCPLEPVDDGQLHKPTIGCATRAGKTVYIHLAQWPRLDTVTVPHLGGKPASVKLLGSRKKLRCERSGDGLILRDLPVEPPTSAGPSIVKLTFPAKPRVDERAIARQKQCIVDLPPGETVRLEADQAELRARYNTPWQQVNRFPDGLTSIGHMYHYDSVCLWRLRLARGGTYKVVGLMGAGDIQSDAVFGIEACGQKIKGKTVCTGHYKTPGRVKVGKLKLKKGRHTLTLRILDMPHGYMADVHGIILQPA